MTDVAGSGSQTGRPRVAVLIDLENTSHRLADRVFREASLLGDIVVRRGYADFSRPLGWNVAINQHLIEPVHRFALSKGKNSSDIALTIDAMELLYEGFGGRIDVFCVVTSDGDFGQIVCNMRAKGREAIGMGAAPASGFRQSCTRYISLVENKVPDSPTIRPVDVDIVRVFEVSIAQMRAEDGWATLAEVGNTVIKLQPGFKPKHYGFKKLKDMADSIPGFEVEQMDGGVVRIRSLGVTEYDVAESEAGNDGSEEPKYGFDGDNVIQLVACG
jgi:uncharacterized protein (TIGR00288 family)